MHWDDIIVRLLEELFSEFGSDIILLLLQHNAAQLFDLALNVDVPEFRLHAIKFSTDASTKLLLKSDSKFRRWTPVLPYSLLNWKQSVRFVLCFDPGVCSHSFGYVLAFLAFTVWYLSVRALKVSVAILAAFFLSVLAVIRPFGSFQMSGTAHVLGASSVLNRSIANSVSHLHALADVMFIFAQVKFLTDQLYMLVSAYKHHVAHPQASAWCAVSFTWIEVANVIPDMASLGTGCSVLNTLIAIVLSILCFDPGIGCYNCYGWHKYKMLVFARGGMTVHEEKCTTLIWTPSLCSPHRIVALIMRFPSVQAKCVAPSVLRVVSFRKPLFEVTKNIMFWLGKFFRLLHYVNVHHQEWYILSFRKLPATRATRYSRQTVNFYFDAIVPFHLLVHLRFRDPPPDMGFQCEYTGFQNMVVHCAMIGSKYTVFKLMITVEVTSCTHCNKRVLLHDRLTSIQPREMLLFSHFLIASIPISVTLCFPSSSPSGYYKPIPVEAAYINISTNAHYSRGKEGIVPNITAAAKWLIQFTSD